MKGNISFLYISSQTFLRRNLCLLHHSHTNKQTNFNFEKPMASTKFEKAFSPDFLNVETRSTSFTTQFLNTSCRSLFIGIFFRWIKLIINKYSVSNYPILQPTIKKLSLSHGNRGKFSLSSN